jgi:hypothetical protein
LPRKANNRSYRHEGDRHGRACPGHPRLLAFDRKCLERLAYSQHVDGRVKPLAGTSFRLAAAGEAKLRREPGHDDVGWGMRVEVALASGAKAFAYVSAEA